jgi:1-hydroxycarotenoid 3,4-desaturase
LSHINVNFYGQTQARVSTLLDTCMGVGLRSERIVIIGAGIGGLAAAMVLAARGQDVTVLEKAATPGGKMREIVIGGHCIDAGPTVLTMRDVFEGLFEAAGAALSEHIKLERASIIARHAWDGDGTLDLYADAEQSVEAIGRFAGRDEARAYRNFCQEAREIYRVLERTFIQADKPSLPELIWRIGLLRFHDLWRINPYQSLWSAVCRHMSDPRLRQMFARYATYCGSSPFGAPATLMLVAYVEQQGVWLAEGGMHRLAEAMMKVATGNGAVFRFETEAAEVLLSNGRPCCVKLGDGEQLPADAVVVNADISAAGLGLLGPALKGRVRSVPLGAHSLSALTWALVAPTSGFQLARHTIFFSRSPYHSEFQAIFDRGSLPEEPTIYVCGQDRDGEARLLSSGAERLLCIVNAPPCRPQHLLAQPEIEKCEKRIFALMKRCGLSIQSSTLAPVRTAPTDFAAMFPGSNGAIYGRASHGWMASFRRQGARCRIPGLYFSGGSVHPGAGVPMAALSGRLAAEALLSDLPLAKRFRPVATGGGILTRSAATGSMD